MASARPSALGAALALLLAAAALLVAPAAGQISPGPVVVAVGGVNYSVVTASCLPLSNCNSLLLTSVTWGNQSLASDMADAVDNSLGSDDWVGSQTGPVFAYDDQSTDYGMCARIIGSITVCGQFSKNNDWSVAIASVVAASPSPSASPDASPSPSPSPGQLDCSSAAFNLPTLSSRLNSQICAANKAVRMGKTSKFVTSVTLSLPGASINITDIVTNRVTAGWQCRCRPTTRDNCTCLPNAVLLGGGSFLVMPQWRRSTLPGRVVDTTLQVSFTATSNGGTCTGTAVICSAWGVRPNRPAPACAPFNSTGATRPALTCV